MGAHLVISNVARDCEADAPRQEWVRNECLSCIIREAPIKHPVERPHCEQDAADESVHGSLREGGDRMILMSAFEIGSGCERADSM